jgi:hypothetical protein
MNRYGFQIGCDPEVFVTKGGKPASAYGLLQGTKEKPFKTQNGAYQVDGMAAEFNTDPVSLVTEWGNDSGRFEEWNARILEQQQEIRKALPKGYSLRVAPTMEFGKEFLDKQPDEAKELGCDPDYNAYTLKPNPRPDGEKTFRTGAGHIHIGWGADIPVTNEEHIQICAGFVKMLDATVGMFMTYIDRDPKRRELYGKAGCFRPKPYGVEYRTPSNAWLANMDYRRCVWELTSRAIKFHRKQVSPSQMATFDNIEEVINTGNAAKAKVALSHIFYNRYSSWFGASNNSPYPPYVRRVFERIGD